MAGKRITRFSADADPAEIHSKLSEQSEAARLAWVEDPSPENTEHMEEVMGELRASRAYWRGIRQALGQPSIVTEDNV